MKNVDDIRKLKTYLVDDYYSMLRLEQDEDNDYYNDKFSVKDIIKPPVKVMRTGKARRLIDGPADHIVTSNPQAARISFKNTQEESKVAQKVNDMLNIEWLPALKKQNPNAYKQHIKYNLLRGEVWIQVSHNPAWVTGKREKEGLPVLFNLPDPMIVFASPNEDCNGVPEYVFIYCERSPIDILNLYPEWTNPKQAGQGVRTPKTVQWLAFIDKKSRYFEADGIPVLKDEIQPNIYGFVPFVHKLAGFGTNSPDSKPEDLVVGRLRFSRDTLRRECAIVSSLDCSIHTYANRSIDVQGDDMNEVPRNFAQEYEIGDGVVHILPKGIKVKRSEEMLPEPQIFQYLFAVQSQLEREDPLVLSGVPVGESGRLQDMTKSDALARYDGILENAENAFATAIGMGLKMLDKVPGLKPDELKSVDLDGNYEVSVKLKAEDPLANDRKSTMGSRMLAASEIDPITNLVDFKGYTVEQAKKIMSQTLMWKVLRENPFVAEFLGWKAVQKAGMADDLEEFLEQKKQIGQPQPQGQGLEAQPSNTEMQRRMGEVSDFEMMDMALAQKGARNSPMAYTRGG